MGLGREFLIAAKLINYKRRVSDPLPYVQMKTIVKLLFIE
jgi:hypothetical protein